MTKHRYVSIIPKPPKGQNSYNAYVKEHFAEAAKQYPDLQRPQIMIKLGEAFKALSESEAEKYKQIAEQHRQVALAEWSKSASEREEKRVWWCKKLDLPTSSSWEDVDRANKRKVKATQESDSDSDVAPGGARTSSQRKATASAREKMKSYELNDSDDERPRKRTSLLSTATAAPGNAKGALKKRQSRLGDAEWTEAIWGQERVAAVNRAIDRVYEMALNRENFDLFGNDMIQCFYDVATVTGEPIRRKTLKYVEHLANRWKYSIMQEGWKEADEPTPSEVVDVIIGMYCMERVGIRHDLKPTVLEFMKSDKAYTAQDYFSWDPFTEPPRRGIEILSECEVSQYRLMSNSLIHSFYADRVGLTLGCDFAEIFKWLPELRPYKSPTQLPWQEYIDQCYLITHVIFTCNNWGELRLDPSLYPHEYYFLRANLEIHMQQRDVHLIAEFVESLRCFGCDDKDPLIRKGMRTLMELQESNGIWDYCEDEPYRTYHATMCGAQALLAHRFRGFGPGIPSVVPLLFIWIEKDVQATEEYQSEAAAQQAINDAKNRSATTSLPQSYEECTSTLELSSITEASLAELKVSMKNAAKELAKDVPTSQSPTSDVDIDDATRDTLQQLTTHLSSYVRGDAVDIDALRMHIKAATVLSITADIVVFFGSLPKDLKMAAKGKGKANNAEVNSDAAALMQIWKNQISAKHEETNTDAVVSSNGSKEQTSEVEKEVMTPAEETVVDSATNSCVIPMEITECSQND